MKQTRKKESRIETGTPAAAARFPLLGTRKIESHE
jgi:hypothetical protein